MTKYRHVVDLLIRQLSSGALKPGQKLQSIREFSRTTGFSVVTVRHGYGILESLGIINAIPKSGFLVASTALSNIKQIPYRASSRQRPTLPLSIADLNFWILSSWRLPDVEAFGAIYPSNDVFERRKIRQHMRRMLMRNNPGPDIDDPQGLPQLRDVLANYMSRRGIAVSPDDIVVTGSGLQGLDLALGSITQPGQTVIVESPAFFPQHHALRRHGLQALEVHSHPSHGVDPDQLRHLLSRHRVAACMLMGTNHCPTGVTYPAETLQALVREATRHKVPIIENAIFSELTYSGQKSASLKAFDDDDYVLQFSSCPGVALSGYGVSWVSSRRFRRRLVEQRLFTNLFTGEGFAQEAFTNYLTKENYERALHRMQRTLCTRMTRGRDLLKTLLPAGTLFSSPTGGYMCWLRGPPEFDATKASLKALGHKISLPPGQMFSPSGGFKNFVGLNFSFEWTPQMEAKLKIVCQLISSIGSSS